MFQQLVGFYLVLYYGPNFIKSAGFQGEKETSVLYGMLCLGLLLVGGNILYYLFGQKLSRRTLMLLSLPPMGFAFLTILVMTVINSFSDGF